MADHDAPHGAIGDELRNAELAHSLTNPDGSVQRPRCCGQPMNDAGGCKAGCCDYYTCAACGKRLTIEWPD